MALPNIKLPDFMYAKYESFMSKVIKIRAKSILVHEFTLDLYIVQLYFL